MVFWQSPRTREQARPDVRLPTARAAGLARSGDRGRRPRALCLVFRPASGHGHPGPALRRLCSCHRREPGRRSERKSLVDLGVQPDGWPAALRTRRARHAARNRGRRGGPPFADLLHHPVPAGAGGRPPGVRAHRPGPRAAASRDSASVAGRSPRVASGRGLNTGPLPNSVRDTRLNRRVCTKNAAPRRHRRGSTSQGRWHDRELWTPGRSS